MKNTSLPKDKIKVLLLEGVHPGAIDCFRADGYSQIDVHKKALADDELRAAVASAHILGIRSRSQLTDAVFSAAPKLIAVGCFCIGTNQVDLQAAQRRGIPVFNAPFSNTRSVAELVLAEMILLLRRIPEKNARCHRGAWTKSAEGSFEARGKTLGIIGYGHIGTQLGILAEGLGMRVLFYDIENKLSLGNAEALASLDELLARADVVTLHVPETPQTEGMMGARELAAMKKGGLLINASRGSVVDIEALAAALRDGHLAGAAIDVFPREPTGNDDEFITPLRGLDNVILTPHVGGSTEEAQANIGIEVADKLVKYSNNGSTVSAVNFPEVSLPLIRDKHRLLHIHRNEPGVLSCINGIFAENGINIAGQYLQTNENIGYVVIDVDSTSSVLALEKLKEVPGTIRCRILY